MHITEEPAGDRASHTPRRTADSDVEKIDQMCGLLRSLHVAIEDIRDQLSAQRKDLLTVGEVAHLVGRSSYSVRRWISEGRIEAIRIEGTGPKGRLLIPREQLDSLVKAGMGATIPAGAVS